MTSLHAGKNHDQQFDKHKIHLFVCDTIEQQSNEGEKNSDNDQKAINLVQIKFFGAMAQWFNTNNFMLHHAHICVLHIFIMFEEKTQSNS